MKMVAEAGVSLTHHYHEDANIQCKNHPYKNGSPGGICALCLQDKLGKLVSSSFPVAVFPSSPSPPSPPSFRSDASTALSLRPQSSDVNHDDSSFHPTRNIFFFSWKKGRKKRDELSKYNPSDTSSVSNISSSSGTAVLKRSKSMATRMSYLDQSNDNDTPRRKGFWSFLVKKTDKPRDEICYPPPGNGKNGSSLQQRQIETSYVVVEENDSPDSTSFDRRVSRSRSVGCGSRSFSGGDLFERISTGFGDCALRRVESHREGKAKMGGSNHRSTAWGQDSVNGRVKCGGLFSGLMVASSSSSASSTEDRKIPVTGPTTVGHKSKSWGWAFASPMRGFSKPPSSAANSNKDMKTTPSILTVGG